MTEMNNNENSSSPRSRVKKGSNTVLYLFIVTIIALIGGFYFYQKNIVTLQQLETSDSGYATTITNPSGDLPNKENTKTPINSFNTQDGDSSSVSSSLETQTKTPKNNSGLPTAQTSSTNSQISDDTPQTTEIILNEESVENTNYNSFINDLNSFYSHLDSQQYMSNFNLTESSKEHFSTLIQKLIDNPPIVTRETDDLFTLLKNTAHFFRIIGKDNILILKGILDREKTSFESILQSFYQLTYKPEYLQEAYSISLDTDALYDYAGFFLHTMGGRLYLFRRDSNSRMAVSFYAILIIDRANNSGDSRHGIDIRPAVDSLIEEIENGGKNLQLRDSYLDTLYDLKEKYS